jgi:uncharacterized lipoprotein YddW (UPF0748 family)
LTISKQLATSILSALCLLIACPIFAQNLPKREFRAVWIATVANIDFPSQRGLTRKQQKAEFRKLLDFHRGNGFNAVVVQVRPAADAFYAKSREPWSYWLTGTQGKPPRPFYDPLAFMIRECRKRNLEFHAWFNPYRAVFDTTQTVAAGHITKTQPAWFLKYGNQRLFNPGLPAVRNYVTQVILDVARNYDIDAVHFDDYFYPYTLANDTLRDDITFAQHPNGFGNKDDWRRHNVSLLIQTLHDSLRAVKPWVKFGISPFGVWRNRSADSTGSDTQAGQTTYDNLYADVRLWLREGWVDYVVPQIYFSTRHPKVNYAKLLDWWTRNSYGRHLYVGQGPYKIARDRDSTWFLPGQTGEQIRLNRTYPQVQGSVFFSSRSLVANPLGVTDTLRDVYYRSPALVPVSEDLAGNAPKPPVRIRVRYRGKKTVLRWKSGDANVRYFAVYRFGQKKEKTELIATVSATRNGRKQRKRHKYRLQSGPCTGCRYVVTALDRTHRESR